jgi:ABC-2 type transport system permease protein
MLNPTTAILPAPTPITGWRKFLIDFKYLFLEQLLEMRTNWYWLFIFSIFMPLSMVFGFTRIGSGLSDRESLLFILSGAAIFAVATQGVVTLSFKIGEMKKEGMLVYYASLPINKSAFVMAVVLSSMLISLPGMVLPILAGPVLYGVGFEFNLWVLLLLPLCALSLSAVGMTLGSAIPSLELTSVLTNILIFVMLFAAPVFIPWASLPLPLQLFAYLLPPTYAADALRMALSGDTGPAFLLNVGVLVAMTIVSFWGLTRWLRWRTK